MKPVKINAKQATSTEEVMQLLQDERYNTVITYCDHYKGNCTGDYYTAKEFERRVKEYGVNWYQNMDDRGILEIFFVENKIEEIYTLVRKRLELLRKIEYTRYCDNSRSVEEREKDVKVYQNEMYNMFECNLDNFYISSRLYSYEMSNRDENKVL